jgi:divalent metal cation (Fe/Co/Zn/Cd) transporter
MEFDFWTILTIVIGVVATLFGTFWKKAQGKLLGVYLLAKEAVDVAKAATDALEDNKITEEEIAKIKKEAQEVKDAWHNLLGK